MLCHHRTGCINSSVLNDRFTSFILNPSGYLNTLENPGGRTSLVTDVIAMPRVTLAYIPDVNLLKSEIHECGHFCYSRKSKSDKYLSKGLQAVSGGGVERYVQF